MTEKRPRNCPVCKTPAPDPLPEFCAACGWELAIDISLTPSIDLTEETVRAYERKLSVARQVWNKREAENRAMRKRAVDDAALKELQARLARAESEKNELRRKHETEKQEMEDRLKRMEAQQAQMMKAINQMASREEATAPPAKKEPPEKPPTPKPKIAKTGRQPGHLMDGPLPEMKLAWIPPGEFMMGSPKDEPGRYDNEKQHRVILTTGFWMQTTPVTQAQWKALMGNNPSYFPNAGPDAPVEMVSWNDAQSFLHKLNQKAEGWPWRLPTEAEWEYACRAGTSTALYNGSIEILADRNAPALDPIACYGGNSGVKYDGGYDSSGWSGKQIPHQRAGTHPVGQKQPNAWGLYDMIGNVLEWCSDWYDIDFYSKSPIENPTGPTTGEFRVSRGGSWITIARLCRAASRFGFDPAFRGHDQGFRLVASQVSEQ